LATGLVVLAGLFAMGHKTVADVRAQSTGASVKQKATIPPELRDLPLKRNLPEILLPAQPPATVPNQAAAEPAPPAQAVPVGFRLQNADLLQVINLIAAQLKLNYVVDPAVKGTVTINTAGELRREDLLPVLETILKMNGATAIKTGNFYRIVPLAQAPKMPLPVFSDETGKKLPSDDRMVMEIIPLRFISADDASKVLSPFLSDGGAIAVHEGGNVLLIEDNSLNMKRLMEILGQFDNPDFARQRIRLVPVHNNVASSLIPELQSIFSAYALSEKSTPISFVPLDRINAILVVAPDPTGFAEVERWVEKLDLPAPPSGIQTFVYQVKNTEADYVAKILVNLYSGAPGRAKEVTPTKGTGAEAGPGDPPVHIVTDSVNNSLLIQTTAQTYSRMLDTLKEIDVVPRQVLIDARVYEVDLTGALSFGLSYFLQQRSNAFKQPLASFSPSTALQASAGALVGQTREFLAFLNASENRSRVHVLSEPTVLATDNSEARIQVGASVPILTSQAVVGGVQVGSTSVFTNTIQNVDTGVILTVTPRITSSGLVSMKITQEVSSVQPPPTGAIQSPTIQKRIVTTHAIVADGESVALGGAIQNTVTVTRNRIPLLGDIPGLGTLFGQTTRDVSRTELIVLLTPHIILNVAAFQNNTSELIGKLRQLRQGFKDDKVLNPPTPTKPQNKQPGPSPQQ
jgi:general secretion pathway protein D